MNPTQTAAIFSIIVFVLVMVYKKQKKQKNPPMEALKYALASGGIVYAGLYLQENHEITMSEPFHS